MSSGDSIRSDGPLPEVAGRPPSRFIRLAGRELPLILPSWRDPRLHLAAVIVSLQVLGQTVLRFQLSIAQILVSVLTCALLEVGITAWRQRVIMWPASALLTGNGVAFLLRVPGTRYGDWWSLHGAGFFALAAALSLLSKYVIRLRPRDGQPAGHVFNPSNIGLVVVLLAFGTRVVNPQDLWWGPMSPGLALTLAIILIGGLTITARLRMLGLVLTFWLTFAAATGVIAASGHCMIARWHVGPVCGGSFWSVLALSPEIFVFMFFMITDPKTTPESGRPRLAYGAGVAFLAALLVAPAGTEFWTKVGVLSGLALMCMLRPALNRALGADRSGWEGALGADRSGWEGALGADRSGWEGTLGADRSALKEALPARWGGLRPTALGIAAVAIGGGLLFIAGIPARPTAAQAGTPGRGKLAAAPPPVATSPAAPPAVTIDPDLAHIDASVTPAVAQQMGQDLVDDLAIAGMAVQTRSPSLAASAGAATGTWLSALDHQIAARGTPEAATYSFSAMTVVAVTNPLRPQDAAQLGIAAKGTRRTGTAESPLRATFVLTPVGGRYLISAEDSGA